MTNIFRIGHSELIGLLLFIIIVHCKAESQLDNELRQRLISELGITNVTIITERRVTLTEDVLPFLGKELSGKSTWQLEIEIDPLIVKGQTNRFIRKLIATAAPDTGHLMKIESLWPPGETEIAPYPPAQEEERQLRQSGARYNGLPKVAPKVSLFQCIERIGMINFRLVKQIIACYVLDGIDRPVWLIQTRGFPPFDTMSFPVPIRPEDLPPPEVAADAHNHFRHCFDADTGAWIVSDTIPQPISKAPRQKEK